MTKLTDAQRELVQQNIRLVSYVLSRYWHVDAPDWEDAVQVGCIGLCNAAATYNPQRATFTTHATRCILSAMHKRYHAEQARKRVPRKALLSLDAPLTAAPNLTLSDALYDPRDDVERMPLTLDAIRALMDTATQWERKILAARMDGRTLNQIGAQMGVSHTTIGNTIRIMRDRAREMEVM